MIKFSGLLFAGAQLGFSPVIKTVVSEVIILVQFASSEMLKPEKQNVTDMLIYVKYRRGYAKKVFNLGPFRC